MPKFQVTRQVVVDVKVVVEVDSADLDVIRKAAFKKGRNEGWRFTINPYREAEQASFGAIFEVCPDCEGTGKGRTPETTHDSFSAGGQCTTCRGFGQPDADPIDF